jgi:hypothetical protein
MVSSTLGKVCTTGGGTERTGLDAGREARVGAKPSGTKLAGIPHENPVGVDVAKWAVAAGTIEVATSEITVLWGGVAGVGEDWFYAAMTDSINVVNLENSSFSSLFSCSKCSMILG